MNLVEMKQNQKAALDRAEAIVKAAEATGSMSDAQTTDYNAAMAEFNGLNQTIKSRESLNTVRNVFGNSPVVEDRREASNSNPLRSAEYFAAMSEFIRSAGKSAPEVLRAGFDATGNGFKVMLPKGWNAASYEGGSTSGAPIVPSQVEQSFVPLAPPVYGIESIASVIPTTQDLKFPRKTAHGTAALKAEGTGNGSNLFTGSTPTVDQYTLSAYMIGHPEDISWELAQDVPAFLSFLQDDILLSLATKKAAYFVTGSGSSQPQGIKGHVAAPTAGGLNALVADSNSNLLPLAATLDLVGTLNPVYRANARFVMTVATGINLRKQQLADNIYNQVFTTVNGVDYLHGFPITYDNYVDEIAATATPLYFGDFKAGYQIGLRGGAGVNVKFLDQPKALEGLLTVLGYQRVDARVRRSEAIQSVTLHA
jgi:HK97 family phage major capsid protein